MRTPITPLALAPSLLALLLGCGDGATAPPSAEVEKPPPTTVDLTVVVATTGADVDPDGYTLRLDGGPPRAVEPRDTLLLVALDPGEHTLLLENLAPNCLVEGEPSRVLDLSLDSPAPTEQFTVACGALVGSILVSADVSGPGEDPDGFEVLLDGDAAGLLSSGSDMILDAVPVGNHTVELTGVAGNCEAVGSTTHAVSVEFGDTAAAAFALTCDLVRGSLRVAASTGGWRHDGYDVRVEGPDTAAGRIEDDGEVLFGGLPVGDYRVSLSSPASCSGATTAEVEVAEGEEASVGFTFECVAPRGRLTVSVSTVGQNPDPDGYFLILQGVNEFALPVNGSVDVGSLTPGGYAYSLAGVAANCTVSPPTTGTVRIEAGVDVVLAFGVSCAWAPPTLLSPVGTATVVQNDPATPCSPHPTRGRGFAISFDWSDLSHPSGMAYYEIRVQREGAPLPLLHVAVGTSDHHLLACNDFVADPNLTDWRWWVRGVAVDGEAGPWTEPASFRFEPCRLDDGTPCNAPG